MLEGKIDTKTSGKTTLRVASLKNRKAMTRFHLVLVCIVAIAIAAGYIFSDWFFCYPDTTTAHYVGRNECVVCHQEQAEKFKGSDHDLAMDVANKSTVLGTFDGSEIEHFGLKSRVFMEGEKYMVSTDGADGQIHDYEIKYVFGVRPLQQYMVEVDSNDLKPNGVQELGRIQVLRETWDSINNRWFYLSPPDVSERLEPNDPLHWTGSTQCWNTSCAECHSTNLKKGFEALTAKYHTTFSEMDVSCEACHGPGSIHVAMANRASLFWDRKIGFGLNRMKVPSNVAQVETCAPCHSRRSMLFETWRPGTRFADSFVCQLIEAPIYHIDGQIRDEDYEFGSFTQSKMFANGIKCSDCHDPHSLKVKSTGNQLCTSCHQHPAGKYDSPDHHFHQAGSTGASCVECHMPATVYMDVDARRDHSLRAPRPDMTIKFGTPNACTRCHLDKSKLPENEQKGIKQYSDWINLAERGNQVVKAELQRTNEAMAAAFQRWYGGHPSPLRNTYYHDLANLLSVPAKSSTEASKEFLRDLLLPSTIRSSALLHLAGDTSDESLSLARQALQGNEPKVIVAALPRIEMELRRLSATNESEFSELITVVGGLLNHESPAVRIGSVRLLWSFSEAERSKCRSNHFDVDLKNALELWRKSLMAQNDRPESHMILGDIYATEGQLNRAIDCYRTSIRVEKNFVGPRTNLCQILSQQLEAKLQAKPRNPSPFDESEARRLNEEIDRLRREEHELLATDLRRSQGLLNAHFIHYRYAMSCYLVGDKEGLEKHLKIAHELQPDDETYLLALAALYRENGDPSRALEFAKKLIEIAPTNTMYRQLFDEITHENR